MRPIVDEPQCRPMLKKDAKQDVKKGEQN